MNVERVLQAALGKDRVLDDAGCTVRPQGPEDARRAVEVCAERRRSWRPGLCSGDRSRIAIGAPEGVFAIWPDELLARVGAGTSFAALEACLAPRGLELGARAFPPEDTTIGAAFAMARQGWWSGLGRSLRERVIGMRFVDGGGRVLQSGSRVVKSVAGFDILRLHHGAGGSLGLVVDLTLRLRARPSSRAMAFVACDQRASLERLAELRRAGSTDAILELWMNDRAAEIVGLPSAGLLVEREGDAVDLERWIAVGGVRRVAVDPGALHGELTAGGRTCIRAVDVGDLAAAAWTGAAVPVVHDCLAGHSWIAFTMGSGFALDSLVGDATFWFESGACPAAHEVVDPVAELAARRLRAVFDPHGLLPPPPRAFRCGRPT